MQEPVVDARGELAENVELEQPSPFVDQVMFRLRCVPDGPGRGEASNDSTDKAEPVPEVPDDIDVLHRGEEHGCSVDQCVE